jgi:sulfatase maturation enzyme AslB (radical SAM superfamily)
MSLIYRRKILHSGIIPLINDYLGEIVPFAKRIDRKTIAPALILLKTLEWSIYRWYKTPIRRAYGVRGNELIYMMTRRCNERCPKCGIWKTPESDSERIDVGLFIRCLRQLHGNLYQVTLTGGEPLLFVDDVLAIARESRDLAVPMLIVTNGSLITEDFLSSYAELGHVLVISIDTLDQAKWTDFRGRNDYDLVMNNLRLAKNILKGRLRVQSVLARETEDDILKIRNFCSELGIMHIVQPYMDFGGVWHESSSISDWDHGSPCAARKNICIYYNGDVVKCFDHLRIPLAREPLGNIAKEGVIPILCKKRATEVGKLMKTCDLPCKRMSCNLPATRLG